MTKSESIKIMVLGNSSVGKTSFILKYTEDIFRDLYISTIGIDNKRKIIKHSNNKEYSLIFYDTAGQEKYKSISLNIIKNADGVLLIYDITKQDTFEAIASWMENIENIKGKDFPLILIGNKLDLENIRVVSPEEGKELASKYKVDFFETSNKNGTNIENACLALVNIIINRRENNLLKEFEIVKDENIKLDKKNISKPKKHRC
jgi:small GTP-binding protein